MGGFAIGTTEFASMSLLPFFSAGLGVDEPTAGHVISAYALGVVVGAPVIAILAAKMARRTLLLLMMTIFTLGNVCSAMAPTFESFTLLRFITGLPHGAFFGVAALVAALFVFSGSARAEKVVDYPDGGNVTYTVKLATSDSPVSIAKAADPASAVRNTPDSSIVRAARAVAAGEADALVSGGSTGAALAAGLFNIKRDRGIYRPALAIPVPIPNHPVTVGAMSMVRITPNRRADAPAPSIQNAGCMSRSVDGNPCSPIGVAIGLTAAPRTPAFG